MSDAKKRTEDLREGDRIVLPEEDLGAGIEPRQRATVVMLTQMRWGLSVMARVILEDRPADDADGLRENSHASRGHGFRGRFAIHPAQIEVINQVYSPSEAEVEHARRVIAAFETAAQQGRGSTSLDGKVVDVPVVKRAQALLDLAMTMRSQAD